MAILFFLALAFILLMINDHSRQAQLEQGMAEYMNIEYRHMYPVGD
mgnify:CR=1 FL=1